MNHQTQSGHFKASHTHLPTKTVRYSKKKPEEPKDNSEWWKMITRDKWCAANLNQVIYSKNGLVADSVLPLKSVLTWVFRKHLKCTSCTEESITDASLLDILWPHTCFLSSKSFEGTKPCAWNGRRNCNPESHNIL